MDYKSTLIKILASLIILPILAGCDTDISPEPLRIIGDPPEDMYYGSTYKFEFGASGGDGVYRYRYIQNPVPQDERDGSFAENTVDMSIQVKDDAKASFNLIASPKLPDDLDISSVNSQKLEFGLELTDGKNTVTKNYEFTLRKNSLSIENVDLVTEGSVSDNVATQLVSNRNNGDKRVCKQVYERNFEKGEVNGQSTYPFVFQAVTDVPVAERTVFTYRLRTNYSEISPEKSDRNIGNMRKDVDYLDMERKITLEPGEGSCIAFIEFFDDAEIEGTETVTVEFFDVIGGSVDITSARKIIELRDNEPTPKYKTDKLVRNRGQSVTVPIQINRPFSYPISINLSVDEDETTALAEDYSIEPQSRVLTFQPGEIQASYTVNLLPKSSESDNSLTEDRVVTITTDIDTIVEADPYSIEINDWAVQSNSQEIVGSSANDESAIDFVVEEDGYITTLFQSSTATNVSTILRSFDRDSNSVDFIPTGDLELSKMGVDVIPIAIEKLTTSSTNRVVIILNVNGLYADVYRGGLDFVVMVYDRTEGGSFSLVSAKQFGTQGDDFVQGALLKGSNLYVYGSTDGQDFEGSPSSDTSSGGQDSFIYSIDANSNDFRWARLFGTADNDSVASLDAGNRDIITINSTVNSDQDVFVKALKQQNGFDREDSEIISFSSVRDENPVSVVFDSSASNFSILIDSTANIDEENEPTPSLSRDAQLKTLNLENEAINYLSFATSQDDIAKSLIKMSDNLNLVVAGDTYGRFEDNVKAGSGDSDIFAGIVNSEKISSLEISKILQFGTPENDNLIKVRPASKTKFFMLWGEDFSSSGNTTYRVSAFSIDGEKLSRDPEKQ